MPTLSEKFRIWLRKLGPPGDVLPHGTQAEIGRRVGWHPTRVNKLVLHGKGKDVGLDEFEKLATTYLRTSRRDDEGIWVVLREIADGRDPAEKSENDISPEQKLKRQIRRLFATRPERGARVVENLIAQDEAGLTDLISAVVHEIIDTYPEHPRKAIPAVVKLIDEHRMRKPASKSTDFIAKYREEYQKLQ